MVPMMALMTNASIWPMTIANSPRPARLPRRSVGASSARYTGTVTEAPPTAKPRITREGTITSRFGANTQPMVPTKKMTARMVSVFFRPRASLSLPQAAAPTAAPSSRLLVTRPSVVGVSPRSTFIGSSAPLITPVS